MAEFIMKDMARERELEDMLLYRIGGDKHRGTGQSGISSGKEEAP